MQVLAHDIAPDGDLYIVLKSPYFKNTVPRVSRRMHGKASSTFIADCLDREHPKWYSRAITTHGYGLKENVQHRFLVSSQTLTTVSPMFKTMLGGGWKESAPAVATSPSSATAIREVSTHGWNPHALITVLNIIHGRHNDVPKKVSIEFFVKVAAIVDYYQCAEAVSLATNLWRTRLGWHNIPDDYGNECIMFLCLAWVFSWPEVFKPMAYLVLEKGEGLKHVRSYDLPIAPILEKLDDKRVWALNLVYRNLRPLRKQLHDGRRACCTECKYMSLGTLDAHKEAMKKEFGSWEYTAEDRSVYRVRSLLGKFPPLEWKCPNDKDKAHPKKCSIEGYMESTFKEIEESFKQVQLADFQAKKV
ncbi:hypothetical protein FPANT_3861 [Fusarium pseudoanthophilum]|uniref:BTB domain-containing protein n=1 Tax=Fusarium pseudoanthophilum TaxID=48495 RepID=A0A8H5UT21_9HYPO|nr:hypothetical protein FPANT_3861 [Fusarium pseudoanthophilum]